MGAVAPDGTRRLWAGERCDWLSGRLCARRLPVVNLSDAVLSAGRAFPLGGRDIELCACVRERFWSCVACAFAVSRGWWWWRFLAGQKNTNILLLKKKSALLYTRTDAEKNAYVHTPCLVSLVNRQFHSKVVLKYARTDTILQLDWWWVVTHKVFFLVTHSVWNSVSPLWTMPLTFHDWYFIC